jgi:hypothetical protein
LLLFGTTHFSELHRELLKTGQDQIRRFLNPPKYASDEQFCFEKPAAQCPPTLKAGQGNFACSEKTSENSKDFGT